MDNVRPFAGIEVVEFGQFIAVPFCAQVLSEGGANVVKVESVEGDPVRLLAPLAPGETRHFVSRNRGKRSLPLDLHHPSAARIVERLVGRADVVLTNFRPGLAAELGLDWQTLAPKYPRLVVGNVSAFGRRGPAARLAGMDLVVQARSGLMAASGRIQDGVPTGGENPAVDYMCAMLLSFGIASALLRRATTGRGGEVDVSLLMAALLLQNNSMVRIESADGPVHDGLRARLAELRAAGRPYTEQVTLTPQIRTPAMTNIYYRTYATRDTAIAVACGSLSLRRAFIKALGLTDPALDRPIADRESELKHYSSRSSTRAAFPPRRSSCRSSCWTTSSRWPTGCSTTWRTRRSAACACWRPRCRWTAEASFRRRRHRRSGRRRAPSSESWGFRAPRWRRW